MVTCEHCGEQHPENAKFCAETGKALSSQGRGSQAQVVTEPVRPLGDEKGVLDLLREAYELYRASWKTFLISAAVLFVPGSLLSASAAPHGHSTLAWLANRAITGLLLYGLVLPLTQGALTIGAADRILGGADGWRDHWGALLRRTPLLVSALVPVALILAVGFLLAMLPGLVLAFFFLFVIPVVLLEGLGGTAALKRSYELVRSDWLRTALMLITFGFANGLAHWLAWLLFGGHFLGSFLGNLLLLVVMPVPIIASVLLYLDLRRKRDGLSEEALRATLDELRAPLRAPRAD